jgi:RHS repeat-associated protein
MICSRDASTSWVRRRSPDGSYRVLSDAQLSVREVMSATASVPVERRRYTAYGERQDQLIADFNGDGFVDFFDDDAHADAFEDGVPAPDDMKADVNGDGIVDFFDLDAFAVMFDPGAAGALPAVRHGYCGYVEDRATGLWLARFRWYDADTGRWIQRDPAGYVEILNFYDYCTSAPPNYSDPFGLEPEPPSWSEGLTLPQIEDELKRTRAEKEALDRAMRDCKGDEYRKAKGQLKYLQERERGLKTAKKVMEQSKRIDQKNPGRGIRRGAASLATVGAVVSVGMAVAFFMNDAAELVKDKQSKCHRFLQLTKKIQDGTMISSSELESAGRECALELGERMDAKAWEAASIYIDHVVTAYRDDEATRKKDAEDAKKKRTPETEKKPTCEKPSCSAPSSTEPSKEDSPK